MSNKSENPPSGLARRVRPIREEQTALFDLAPSWKEHWWGMPSFEQRDARPLQRVTVNLMTREDADEFSRRLGVRITPATDSIWFPPETIDRPSDWEYGDE